MSTWSNLANNRFLSYKNIQNGVLAGSISVFTGASISYTDQWINKLSFSNSVPHFGTTSYDNKLDNQFITKTDIVPAVECPCYYVATYSQFYNGPSVIPGYECVNIDKATAPASFSTAQRVQSNAWNRDYWSSTYEKPRLYNLGFSNNGSGIFKEFGFTTSSYGGFVRGYTDTSNYFNTVWVNADNNTTEGRMNSTAVWVTNQFYTITSTSSLVNGYYTNATPVAYTVSNSVWEPLDTWIGFLYTFIPVSNKTYYFGVSGDNLVRVKINGTTLIDSSLVGNDGGGGFPQWCIYPIILNSGVNYTFSFEVKNASQVLSYDILGNPAGFSAELYDFTGLTVSSGYPILTDALTYGITSTASLQPYILFSTKDMSGRQWDYGQSVGYYCNNGGSLYQDPNTGLYMCLAVATQSSYSNNCLTIPYFTMDIDQTINSLTASFRFGVNTTYYSVDWGDGYIEGSTSSITFTPITRTIIPVSATAVNANLGYSQAYSDSGAGGFLNGKCRFSHKYANPGIYTIKFIFQNGSGQGIQMDLNGVKIKNLKFYNNWASSGSIPGIIYLNNSEISIPRQNLIIPQVASPTLTLENNNITVFDVDNYSSYIQLDLTYNFITNFNPSYQINSAGLLLDHNSITNFLPSATLSFYYANGNAGMNNVLSLSYNNLVNFNPSLLVGLYQLGLNNNNITTFNPTTQLPTTLATLNLQRNSINNFSLLNNPIILTSNTYFTSTLYLDYNTTLTSFNPYCIIGGVSQSALSAKNISITNCGLTGSFSPDYLITITGSSIALDHNNLTNYDPKTYLTGLAYLSLTYNKISNFDPSYQPLPSTLLSLNLQINLINNFDPINYSLPSSLQNLNLNGNTMSNFNPVNYPLPSSLQTLLLEGNNIQSFSCSLPSNLRYLDLSYNPLTYINGNSFNNVNGLLVFAINFNKTTFSLTPTTAPNFGNIPFVATGSLAFPPVYGLFNTNITQYAQIGFWTANSTQNSIFLIDSANSGVGLTAVNGISFSNNLSNITIWSTKSAPLTNVLNVLNVFNPVSLPTNLQILDLNGQTYGNNLLSFNFDLLLGTKIKTVNLSTTKITSATASSTLPNTLTSISFNGVIGNSFTTLSPLNYIDPTTIISQNVTYLNFAYCSLTSSIIQSVLDQLVTNGATSGTIYFQNQYNTINIVTSGMSASLHTLINRNWKCYATASVSYPYTPILFT